MDARHHSHAAARTRRQALGLLAGLLPVAALAAPAAAKPQVYVWKGPACGCCNDWIDHLRANGFVVTANDVGLTEARERLGVKLEYASCHTARVGGYAIEGHVPAREIHRLLKEKPKAIGLAVPGMPLGSPGMDGPEYGGRTHAYDVLLLTRDGGSRVFQHYP